MNLILAGLALVAAGTPSQLLLLDVFGKLKAPRSIKLLAPTGLVLIYGVSAFSWLNDPPLLNLILVGALAGIAATIGLDSIRIPGYLLGYMPLDLPLRFGTKALNLDDKFMLGMMPKVMGHVNEQMAKGVPSYALTDASGFPRLPVRVIRGFARPTLSDVLIKNNTPLWRVRLTGYLWHYSNGASFGIAHAILFGRGPWLFTIGFGLLLATVFLTILRKLVPPMKPGLKLPAVVFLAHGAVIIILGLLTQNFVTAAGDSESFLRAFSTLTHL
jgi:hypothetical protein